MKTTTTTKKKTAAAAETTAAAVPAAEEAAAFAASADAIDSGADIKSIFDDISANLDKPATVKALTAAEQRESIMAEYTGNSAAEFWHFAAEKGFCFALTKKNIVSFGGSTEAEYARLVALVAALKVKSLEYIRAAQTAAEAHNALTAARIANKAGEVIAVLDKQVSEADLNKSAARAVWYTVYKEIRKACYFTGKAEACIDYIAGAAIGVKYLDKGNIAAGFVYNDVSAAAVLTKICRTYSAEKNSRLAEAQARAAKKADKLFKKL